MADAPCFLLEKSKVHSLFQTKETTRHMVLTSQVSATVTKLPSAFTLLPILPRWLCFEELFLSANWGPSEITRKHLQVWMWTH